MSLNFQPKPTRPTELPIPSSGFQAALLLVKLVFPSELGLPRPDARRTLALFSRAWGRADSFAYQILQKFEDRAAARSHGSGSTEFQQALRWILPRDAPERPRDPLERFRELAQTAKNRTDCFEAVFTFHHATASVDDQERCRLAAFVMDCIASSASVPRRQRLLKGMLHHFMTDFESEGSLLRRLLLERLTAPEVKETYERSDLIFNQALLLASIGADDRTLIERQLRLLPPEELALAAYMLIVRLGALPGHAWDAKSYVSLFERHYSQQFMSVDVDRFVKLASRYDYGVDLADAMRDGEIEPRQLLAMFAHGLALVGDTSAKRKRALRTRGEGSKEMTPVVRTIVKRFCAWGRSHQFCQVLVRTPFYDARLPDSQLSRDIQRLGTYMMKPPLCSSVASVLLRDMYDDDECMPQGRSVSDA